MRKRKCMVMEAGLAAALSAALVMGTFAEEIAAEDAETIALADAGMTTEDAASVRTKTDREDGMSVYEVEIQTGDYEEYEYEINAENGMILSVSYEAGKTVRAQTGEAVSLEQAMEIAAEHAGEKKEEVTFVKTKTEYDDGRQIHEVEFTAEDLKFYEYEIDADSGVILSWDYDGKRFISSQTGGQTSDSQTTEAAGPDSVLEGLEAAKAAALDMAGLKDTDVTWGRIHEDYEDGRPVFEGEFFCDDQEYEFTVDAENGTIVEWEVEKRKH